MKSYTKLFILFIFNLQILNSQEVKKDYSLLTRDEIVNMSYEELLAIPFEDLLKLAGKLGISIDDLLNMKITVSSKAAMTPRESPGIVSIVTADEISNSGARELTDVLQMVPGFHFGYDIDGAVGIASRGNWGHEGKILILLDGQEMNENFYSTFQFGNRIPVAQIKRIEIIRGPGSSIYGGYAELGVINIITKEGADLKGVEGSVASGFMNRSIPRIDISALGGNKVGDFEFSAGGYLARRNRSNIQYSDFDGGNFNMGATKSRIKSEYLNLSANYKGLKSRLIYDNFITPCFEYTPMPNDNFTSYLGEIKYDWKPVNKILITPRLNIKKQTPWKLFYPDDDYNRSNYRYVANITLQYDLNTNITFTGGTEFLTDRAIDNLKDPEAIFINGEKKINYNNTSAFLQAFIKTKIANLNIGGRFDHHNKVGNNFAPRFALTKIINKFHFKALYSQAFRAPAIDNIDLNPEIKAEITSVTEIESGYQINRNMFITANIFNIYIKSPIVYQYINAVDLYKNFPSAGTKGFEVEYRYVRQAGYVTLNYSYYQSSKNKVTDYDVPENTSFLKGFPKHKASLNSNLKLSENISISPTAILEGSKYGNILDAEGDIYLKKFNPSLRLNLFLTYKNFFVKNLDLSSGAYNITNSQEYYIQPYGDSFPPLPNYASEFVLRLNYKL